jgi:hypothetical protein
MYLALKILLDTRGRVGARSQRTLTAVVSCPRSPCGLGDHRQPPLERRRPQTKSVFQERIRTPKNSSVEGGPAAARDGVELRAQKDRFALATIGEADEVHATGPEVEPPISGDGSSRPVAPKPADGP